MKLQPSQTQFEVIEPGMYAATIDSVTPEDPNPRFEDSRPQLKFIFAVTDADVGDVKIFAWTGQTYGPKSKLRPWLAAIWPEFDPDVDELETEDLVGRRCRLVVVVKTGDDKVERNRVAEVLPAESRKRAAPPAPARPAAAELELEPVGPASTPF